MQERDFESFSKAIAALAMAFDREASDVLYDAYWLGLGDLSIEQIQRSVATAIRELDHFPKPVELRKLAGAYVDGDSRAMSAWSDVQRAIGLGPYKHIDFADRLINATVRNLGGWPSFLSRFANAESEKWARLEFCRTYSAFAKLGVSGELLAPLPGLSQQTARGGVLMLPVPVRVDCVDQQRAKLTVAAQRQLESQPISIEFKRA